MPAKPLPASAVLTHHWLVRRRGGERVLEALGQLLPDAPIHTLIHDRNWLMENGRPVDSPLAGRPVTASILNRFPGAAQRYPKLLPIMPWAARRMKLPDVDLVVCSDAAIAKAMTASPRSKVVCYCHSPMRYAWESDISRQYAATVPAALRPMWPRLCEYLRKQDAAAARRVDVFVANSRHVARRIEQAYGRTAEVVYPPVDVPTDVSREPRAAYYLCVGHHVAYKRLDLAVVACLRMKRTLVVIGDGPEAVRLCRAHGSGTWDAADAAGGTRGFATDEGQSQHYNPNGGLSPPYNSSGRVLFLGRQPAEVLLHHYRRARGLLFPGEEDFGIVPVEAMGHGCPVVAYGVGGAAESVIDGRTGVHFGEATAESLAAAIGRLETLRLDPQLLHEQAQRFERAVFLERIGEVLRGAVTRG